MTDKEIMKRLKKDCFEENIKRAFAVKEAVASINLDKGRSRTYTVDENDMTAEEEKSLKEALKQPADIPFELDEMIEKEIEKIYHVPVLLLGEIKVVPIDIVIKIVEQARAEERKQILEIVDGEIGKASNNIKICDNCKDLKGDDSVCESCLLSAEIVAILCPLRRKIEGLM